MILTKFSGKKLHRFLNVDFSLKKGVNFLIGNNGSGKTSSIEAINALLSPSLKFLGEMEFAELRVDFTSGKVKSHVLAAKIGRMVRMHVSGIEDPLEFSCYISDPDIPGYRDRDHADEYYRSLLSRYSDHPVLSFIASLPNPMFLGLNRRASLGGATRAPRVVEARSTRERRNIFSGSLSQGVSEAVNLAETHHRDTLIEVGRLGDQLRRDMILELLSLENRVGLGPLAAPTQTDLKRIPEMRKGLTELARILKLPESDVAQKVGRFLDNLEEASKIIPQDKSLQELIEGDDSEGRPVFDAIIQWSVNAPELKRIKTLSEMIENYNKKANEITARGQRYQRVLADFLQDSGKHVAFNSRGYIELVIDHKGSSLPISSMSSGESQIFVILTHLFFNELAQENNVFIIDEPELSLHIQWQEIFADSLFSANPNIQYVLATHSPSIILDRVSDCVDVRNSYSFS